MAEHLTIVWAGDHKLPAKLAHELNIRGISAEVGGNIELLRGTPFLGEFILSQLKTSFAVIVLIKHPIKRKAEKYYHGPYRPNLMFEWGFSHAILSAGFVYPILIDVEYSDNPSDTMGIWCPKCKLRNDELNSEDKIAISVAEQFIEHFRNQANPISSGPFDSLLRWPEIELLLEDVSNGNRSYSLNHLNSAIPDIAIPCIFDSSAPKALATIERIKKQISMTTPEIFLGNIMIEYYEKCEYANFSENDGQLSMESLEDFDHRIGMLMNKLENNRWGTIYANNYRGIVLRKISHKYLNVHNNIASQDSITKSNKKARESFWHLMKAKNALRLILVSDHSTDLSKALWGGFIYYNLASAVAAIIKTLPYQQRILKQARLIGLNIAYLRKARDLRLNVYVSAFGKTTPRIESQLLLEYISSEITLENNLRCEPKRRRSKSQIARLRQLHSFAVNRLKISISFGSRPTIRSIEVILKSAKDIRDKETIRNLTHIMNVISR